MEQVVHRRAPAKVNLTLAVLRRRMDGFHELESWVMTVGLFDELTFAPATRLSLTVQAPSRAVPTGASNLVWRAAMGLAEASRREPAVSLKLLKRIPVGAGLGGGSSDAAATLLGLNLFWELNWPVERLMPIAARLGSDVPLFLEPGPAVIRGRGERVERLTMGWEGWLALVVPSYGIPTSRVYQYWVEGGRIRHSQTPVWLQRPGSALELSWRLFNDLEAAAFSCEPRLKRLHAALDGLDERAVRMTGSGSCLFAVFDSETEAEHWRRQARPHLEQQDDILVAKTA